MKLAVVVRQDGTVPFDDGVSEEVRAAVLAHLFDNGHDIERIHGSRHVKIKGWVKGQKVEKHS